MNILAEPLLTADDLLTVSDDRRFELIDGRLLEKLMGARASSIAVAISTALKIHVKPQQLGGIFDGECGYVLFPDQPNRVRRPDISFVRRERFPGGEIPEGWFHLAPDLAVEILSPNNTAPQIASRITDYLSAGVPLLWVIDPATRLVQIFRGGGSAAWLIGSGELKGENVLPGFTCRVEDIFVEL